MINKLITSLNTGVIQFDADGTIKDYNPAVEKLIGVKPKIKQRLSAFTDSIHAVTEDGEMLREPGSLDKLLNSMQSIIISPFAGSEKERKRIKLQILGESGTNSITYLIFEDLSDKKSHDEISTLLDTCETVHKRIHLGVWEHDVVTEEVYWSEELYYLFYRDIELGPPNYSEFTFSIHADDRYEVDEHFQRSLIEGVSCNMDYRTNPTIGPMRYLNTQFSCIMSNNQVVKIYGSNRDITDSVLASKTPGKKDGDLFAAADTDKIGYWEYDVGSDMFTFRDSFYKVLGTTADKMGGYKMSSSRYSDLFLPPEDAMIIGNEALKGLQTKEKNYSKVIKHKIIFANGSHGIVETHLFAVKDKEGKTVKNYGVICDITNEQS